MINLALVLLLLVPSTPHTIMLPVVVTDRGRFQELQLTSIGSFGLPRKARPTVPAHLHSGVDIQRPRPNYNEEPIFAIATGVVISKRDDGAFAQLIIEHTIDGEKVWAVYEHVAGIAVKLGERVSTSKPIARFMTKQELDRFGWQFDHFHFEVLKIQPTPLKVDPKLPDRKFVSHSLNCHTRAELDLHFYNPIEFLSAHMR